MIGFLPALYQDELLSGGLARALHAISTSLSRDSVKRLFGRRLNVRTALNVSGIDCLSSQSSMEIGVEIRILAERHSLLPYAGFLSSSEQYGRLLDAMRQSRSPSQQQGCGSKLFKCPRFLKICPECLDSDSADDRQRYWRRTHQLPGVYLCPDHETDLVETFYRTSGGKDVLPPDPAVAGIDWGGMKSVPIAARQDLLEIARASKSILEAPCITESAAIVTTTLRRLVSQKGYSWSKAPSLVSMRQLVRDMLSRPSVQFLLEPSSADAADRLATALNKHLRDAGAQKHALLTILLLQHMDCSLAEFRSAVSSTCSVSNRAAAVSEQWPCSNPKCARFEGAVGIRLSQTLDNGRHRIQCQHCGFTYSWTSNAPDRVSVLRTGELWDRAIKEKMLSTSTSLRQLSLEFGVSLPALKRHALRLGVWNQSWTLPKKTQSRIDRLYALMTKHRETWQQQQNDIPTCCDKKMSAKGRRAYRFLLKHDRDWLKSHTKEQARKRPSNWKSRELELIARLDEAACLADRVSLHRQSQPSMRETLHFAGIRNILWRNAGALPNLQRTARLLGKTRGTG
ncbi:TnsD family Tn7-like transposition protein [Dongia sp.]|uniref:TnsD family Tn7-like transposition protein n=1 Tax=Dongia sp. TaxID=1977262 RepID=UPI00375255B6